MARAGGERPKVYVLDPYHPKVIERLEADAGNGKIEYIGPQNPKKDGYLADANAVLVRSETKITATDFQQANPNLKYIIKQGVGVDNIDLEAARKAGVKVFNTPALNSEAVAELTITLAFCIARRVCEIDRLIRAGEKVVRSQVLGKSLFGKTLGVVGMGNIGLEVAKKWVALTAGRVVAYDPYAKEGAWDDQFSKNSFTRFHELEELLKVSDVISLHVPLTGSTRNLISTAQFSLMRKDAILLNCARGGVVDEAALLVALEKEQIWGVGLDAMDHEPPTIAQYGETLLKHPRVLMTPHIGASTEENQERSGLAAVQILFDLLDGKALDSLT
jgi:D-3-phosphoglycerate dehydrogenase / 2-oxoglutarate reductase